MGGHLRFQSGQALPDFKGCRQLVLHVIHSCIETGKSIVNLVVEALDFHLDANQAFPNIADAGSDGFLQNLLNRFDG